MHSHSNEVRVGDDKPLQSCDPPSLPVLDCDWYMSRILANLSWRAPTSAWSFVALDSDTVAGSISVFDSNPEES